VRSEPRTTLPLVVTRADCLASEHKNSKEEQDDPSWTYLSLSPKLVYSNVGSNFFEIWVGKADCKDLANRNGAGTDQCARIFKSDATGWTKQVPVKVSLQDAIHALRNLSGIDADTDTIFGKGSAADCSDAALDQSALNFYFLLTDGSTSVKGSDSQSGADRFKVDLLGPKPPTNVDVAAGDTLLFPSWETTTVPNDLAGYRFYCDAGGSASPAGSAGGAGGAGGSSSGTCGGGTLVPGALPPANLKPCGQVTGALGVTGGRAEGLTNGQTYAVGVAAFDKVGNEGLMSELACATPEEVTTFFEAYRNAGGQGGGLCGFAAPGAARNWALLGAVASVALVSWQRRRGTR
jgi:hypothetical protein